MNIFWQICSNTKCKWPTGENINKHTKFAWFIEEAPHENAHFIARLAHDLNDSVFVYLIDG